MPSKSPAQHRLMEAADHTPGGFGGVPQSVGKEFVEADKRKKAKGLASALESYKKSGSWGSGEMR